MSQDRETPVLGHLLARLEAAAVSEDPFPHLECAAALPEALVSALDAEFDPLRSLCGARGLDLSDPVLPVDLPTAAATFFKTMAEPALLALLVRRFQPWIAEGARRSSQRHGLPAAIYEAGVTVRAEIIAEAKGRGDPPWTGPAERCLTLILVLAASDDPDFIGPQLVAPIDRARLTEAHMSGRKTLDFKDVSIRQRIAYRRNHLLVWPRTDRSFLAWTATVPEVGRRMVRVCFDYDWPGARARSPSISPSNSPTNSPSSSLASSPSGARPV